MFNYIGLMVTIPLAIISSSVEIFSSFGVLLGISIIIAGFIIVVLPPMYFLKNGRMRQNEN